MAVAPLASLAALGVAAVAVMFIVGSGAVYGALLGAISFASGIVAVSSLGNDIVDVVVVTVGADVLGTVITAFMAAIFAFKLSAFSRHFFLWARFPCPGPGILSVGAEKKSR